MSAPPRLWRGRVWAQGLWFPPWTPELRTRVLALWAPGASLRRCEGGHVLVWREARPLGVEAAPGMPLVRLGESLEGAVPTPSPGGPAGGGPVREPGPGDTPATPPTWVVLPLGGRPLRHVLAELPPVAVEVWIDPGPVTRVGVRPLGPPAPALVVRAPVDVRLLTGRPPPGASALAAAAALAAGGARGAGTALGWLAGPLGWLGGLLGRLGARAGGSAGDAGTGTPAVPAGPAWWERLAWRALGPLWARTLGGAVGAHLQKVLDLFEGGNLEEALRWALPLGGLAGGGWGPLWGMPGPRGTLRIGGPRGPGASIGLPSALLARFRQLYERALERLLAEGRFEDAAFVLVELLDEHVRAVDLLEKHGRFALAAQIAELKPGLAPAAVRLWVKAGEPARAVLVARRTGAFGTAVEGLEKSDPALATALRLAWARHLAERGDHAQAVTVAWPHPVLRGEALAWMPAAIEAGTPSGAALVAKLVTLPDREEEASAWAERIHALPGSHGARMRLGLAAGIAATGGAASRRLGRATYRQLLRDQRDWPELVEPRALNALLSTLDAPGLVCDRPPPRPPPPPVGRRTFPYHSVAPGDVGTRAVHDLLPTGDGGVLVALGEAGGRWLGRDGRVRASFAEPMDRLVELGGSRVALGVASRPGGVRVCRIELRSGRATPWISGPYGPVSPTSDGNLWFVGHGEALLGLDLLAAEPVALWRLGGLGAPVVALRSDAGHTTAVLGAPVGQRLVYRTSDLWLQSRPATRSPHPDERLVLLPGGWALTAWVRAAPDAAPSLAWRAEDDTPGTAPTVPGPVTLGSAPTPGVPGRAWQLVAAAGEGNLRAAALAGAAGADVLLYADGVNVQRLVLFGARRPVLRLGADWLAVGDERGRVLVLDLANGGTVLDLRV